MSFTPTIDLTSAEKAEYEYLKRQYDRGLLDPSNISRLRKAGYIKDVDKKKENKVSTKGYSGRLEIRSDYAGRTDIKKEDWLPKSAINHTDEFYEWVNSMTYGFFPNKNHYHKFELYKQQASHWLALAEDPMEYSDNDMFDEVRNREFRRIKDNSLYFANRYGKVKEGSSKAGRIDYVAKEHNAVIYFLLDSGYSFIFGKPRQIFATTTMGLFALKNCILSHNFIMKFITEDDKTGKSILKDKIKYPFGPLPEWMQPEINSDSEKTFYFGKKIRKGVHGFPNTSLEELAPSKTAINGQSPQIAFVDEIGNVPDLIDMVDEARPTLLVDKNQDGNLELMRQVVLWGTGVSDNKGKGGYQQLWDSTIDLWENKKYASALFIPLFFSWHTRCSEAVYKEQKSAYYSGKDTDSGSSLEQSKKTFHQHYPSSFHDMFNVASGRLVPKELIDKGIERIRKTEIDCKPVEGYFEPVYDLLQPMPDTSDVPYKIVDAKFIPIDDDDDRSLISCRMLKKPDRAWKDRYYQGTDPIAVETGISYFASTIIDSHAETPDGEFTKAPVCLLYHRKPHDHKTSFLQSILMGLYYDTNNKERLKKGVPELIENNIGTNYKDYKEAKGFWGSIVLNGELPAPEARGGGQKWGMNTSGSGVVRKLYMVGRLRDFVLNYHQNIYIQIYFKELLTYVNIQKTQESWQPLDKRIHRDDALDSLALAYICWLCYERKVATRENDDKAKVLQVKYKRTRDASGNLSLIKVKELV